MKRIRLVPIFVHIYMFITVISALFLFQDINGFLLDLGASSWVIGIVAGGAETANGFVYGLLFFWGISFPVLLIVFYIMACKKRYVPFVVITTIDSVVVLLWAVYSFATKNTYFLESCITDAIVSTLFTAILIICLSIEGQRDKRGQVGQGDGSVVP